MTRNIPSTQQKTWLITGASRGIGLEMARQLLAAGENVVATCRNPETANELQALARGTGTSGGQIKILALDVGDPASITAAAAALKGTRIDVLVNNAGVLADKHLDFAETDFSNVIRSFEINAIGPMRVTRALIPMLEASPRPVVISITSKMGSIDDNQSGGYYAYRMSKTALNMFNMSLARDFKSMICVVMHPGWVKTEMGGKNAPLSPGESVSGMLKVINGLSPENSGKFFDYRGESIPW